MSVKHSFLGITLQPTYYVALESLGLVVFGPLLSPIFARFYIKSDAVDSALKFLASIVFIMLAFLMIVLAIINTAPSALVSPSWLLAAYLCVSIAELLLSPIGLSMSTKLVRPQVVGLMVGIFFVSLGIGGYLAGTIAKIASVPSHVNNMGMKLVYLHAFEDYLYISIGIFIAATILFFLVKKMSRNNLKKVA